MLACYEKREEVSLREGRLVFSGKKTAQKGDAVFYVKRKLSLKLILPEGEGRAARASG